MKIEGELSKKEQIQKESLLPQTAINPLMGRIMVKEKEKLWEGNLDLASEEQKKKMRLLEERMKKADEIKRIKENLSSQKKKRRKQKSRWRKQRRKRRRRIRKRDHYAINKLKLVKYNLGDKKLGDERVKILEEETK